MKTIKLIAASLLTALSMNAADTYTNPVMNSQWGSPYLTAFRAPNGKIYGAIYQYWGRYSDNLVNWQDAYQTHEGAGWYGGGYTCLWPYITQNNGAYTMYYSIGNDVDNPRSVAVACGVSSEPQGFYSHNKVVCTAAELGLNAVNAPFMMQDSASGTKYLFVSSPEQGIYMATLSADGYSLKYPIELKQIASAEMQVPRITWHDGYYYLFAEGHQRTSWSGETALKTIVVGRSQSLTGPYVNAIGDQMLNGYYHTVLSSNPYFDEPQNFSPLITDDEGTQWLVYNAIPKTQENHSQMIMLDRVTWLDGWPMISDGTPSYYPVKAPVIR